MNLVPTDPDVAVLGEELFFVFAARLLHDFLIDGIRAVGGWEKGAPCISSLRCRRPSRACTLGNVPRS